MSGHLVSGGRQLLWTHWAMAYDYAQARAILYHRKQMVRSVMFEERRLWHVMSGPARYPPPLTVREVLRGGPPS